MLKPGTGSKAWEDCQGMVRGGAMVRLLEGVGVWGGYTHQCLTLCLEHTPQGKLGNVPEDPHQHHPLHHSHPRHGEEEAGGRPVAHILFVSPWPGTPADSVMSTGPQVLILVTLVT